MLFKRHNKALFLDLNRGFTLIELLVVVAIVGIFASIVLSALNSARGKSVDAAIKSNLANAVRQAEIFYLTNTAAPNSYSAGASGVCSNPGPVGGATTLAPFLVAAGKAAGLSGLPFYYARQGAASPGVYGNCIEANNSWGFQMPLSDGSFWCMDSTGYNGASIAGSLTGAADTTCT